MPAPSSSSSPPSPSSPSSSGKTSLDDLLPAIVERRDPRALGRAISLLERGGRGEGAVEELIRRLRPHTGRARLIGITGPPGSGKSTLVEGLVRTLRAGGETVAVLAIDPTSPFTGGALLGDRVRMQSLATDPGVFIRSMATRGALGGLAAAAHDAVDVLDAAGFDVVIVETVGVGQDEVDVVRSVDTVAVVVIPGMGDEIQAVKAGLLEIADVFVLNKADREGADRTYKDLLFMLHSAQPGPGDQVAGRAGGAGDEDGGADRLPPVVRTVAHRGEGLEELAGALAEHRRWLGGRGLLAERRRRRLELRIEEALKRHVLAAASRADRLAREVDRAEREGLDPYAAADQLLGELGLGSGTGAGAAADPEAETLTDDDSLDRQEQEDVS